MAFQEAFCNVRLLSSNLKTEGVRVDSLLSQMQAIHDEVLGMLPAQAAGSHRNHGSDHQPSRPIPDLRSASDIKEENQELRLIAMEQQVALDLVMTKYRTKISELQSTENMTKKLVDLVGTIPKAAGAGEGPVGKMKSLMKQSVKADEGAILEEEELISSLRVENRGLRQMLEISHEYASLPATASLSGE